jgi:hypothetical protein
LRKRGFSRDRKASEKAHDPQTHSAAQSVTWLVLFFVTPHLALIFMIDPRRGAKRTTHAVNRRRFDPVTTNTLRRVALKLESKQRIQEIGGPRD